jgi:hypothetical protein
MFRIRVRIWIRYNFGHPGSASGSVSQRYESEDQHADLYQNVTDPQHLFWERVGDLLSPFG